MKVCETPSMYIHKRKGKPSLCSSFFHWISDYTQYVSMPLETGCMIKILTFKVLAATTPMATLAQSTFQNVCVISSVFSDCCGIRTLDFQCSGNRAFSSRYHTKGYWTYAMTAAGTWLALSDRWSGSHPGNEAVCKKERHMSIDCVFELCLVQKAVGFRPHPRNMFLIKPLQM